jgi:hypothetical protein
VPKSAIGKAENSRPTAEHLVGLQVADIYGAFVAFAAPKRFPRRIMHRLPNCCTIPASHRATS